MHTSTTIALITMTLLISGIAEAQDLKNATPLDRAIQKFNADAAKDDIGKSQAPITEEEVLAAIRLAEKADHPPVSDALFAVFKKIADTHQIPPGGEFEMLTGVDPGGDFIFDVWYVRIRLPREDFGSYAFTIRNRIVRARPVGEVAEDLEKQLNNVPPLPGRYRLEDRVRDLKTRAEAAKARTAIGPIPEK